jgi:hypothetical protein
MIKKQGEVGVTAPNHTQHPSNPTTTYEGRVQKLFAQELRSMIEEAGWPFEPEKFEYFTFANFSIIRKPKEVGKNDKNQ